MYSQTKIVATIGPATSSIEAINSLYASGMRVARLNGSHNSLVWHREVISRINTLLPNVPILLDIPGKKIRTMYLATEPTFKVGEKIVLTSDKSYRGTDKVPVSYDELHAHLRIGHQILADDGTLKFVVVNIVGRDIEVMAEVAGQLKSRKGINVPQVRLPSDLITKSDIEMINFAQSNSVDFIGLSFVESQPHVEAFRRAIGATGSPRIISKIENKVGYENMSEIISASDGIMIDRGDLSVETQLETIALKQKQIIKVARSLGKPVIVATEMLHTMTENPYPTKAEVSDICNAVLDGASAVMLSGETAIGKNPDLAVQLMNRVALESERYMLSSEAGCADGADSESLTIAKSIGNICGAVAITKVIVISTSAVCVGTLSALGLRQKIFAISDDSSAAKSFNLLAGVEGVFCHAEFPQVQKKEDVQDIIRYLLTSNKIDLDDYLLIVVARCADSGHPDHTIYLRLAASFT